MYVCVCVCGAIKLAESSGDWTRGVSGWSFGWKREECRIRWPFVDMDVGQIGPFLTPKGFTVGGVCRTPPLGDADTDVDDADAKIGFHCIRARKSYWCTLFSVVSHTSYPRSLLKLPSARPHSNTPSRLSLWKSAVKIPGNGLVMLDVK